MSLLDEKELKNFNNKVKEQTNGCWEWQGAIYSSGYGSVTLARLANELGRKRNARSFATHRVSKCLSDGSDINRTEFVLHKCDNRICVNPDHLFWGTPKDNMQDMISKGRAYNQKGENNGGSKLTQKDVGEIRLLLPNNSNTEIAKIYGVHHNTISLIRLGKTWKE